MASRARPVSPAPDKSPLEVEQSDSISDARQAGRKRKRAPKHKFYCVRIGREPGIYHSWSECLAQITGYSAASYRSFTTLTEAELYMKGEDVPTASQRFYAVREGKETGIYTDWPSAQRQIIGWTNPSYRRFSTRAEAQQFMDEQRPLAKCERAKTVSTPDTEMDQMEPTDKAPRKRHVSSFKPASRTQLASAPESSPHQPSDVLSAVPVDGFDRNILLKAETGNIIIKSRSQKAATKVQADGIASDGWLTVYTDGSSLGNGTKGASAGVGVYFGPSDSRNVSETLRGPKATNQKAELTAIARAIEIVPKDCNLRVMTDSQYAVNCVTNWYSSWQRKGWKTASGKDVEHREIIENILDRISERRESKIGTEIKWVKGHAGDPGNVEADKLAVRGAQAGKAASILKQ